MLGPAAKSCSQILLIPHVKLVALQALSPGGSTQLDAAALEAIAEEAPSARLPRNQIVSGLLTEIMATVKLQASKSASRRMIQVHTSALIPLPTHSFAHAA